MHRYTFKIFILFFSLLIPFSIQADSQENRIQYLIQEKLTSGEKPNDLLNEKSPYLLQHAFNPVNWFPWGKEAFTRAREENKPIFLSIGYSTCHWCHVMAEESFENQAVAELLNRWFISIKVDREERPDIDQMYMAATQALTGSGGWPTSVFLLPDGRPFYAGTYFPPDATQFRPGFKDVLKAVHDAWEKQKEEINATAERLISVLESVNIPSNSTIDKHIIQNTYENFLKKFDVQYGGFGNQPKFPRTVVPVFLLQHYVTTGDEKGKDMVLHTLSKMAAGGIYDHLGGGFHRYSVDRKWLVPHFEKMLYDQAQIANIYLDAYHITYNPYFATIARDIFSYVLRDMYNVEGGFYSAEDADSENPYSPGQHSEGAFYLWSKEDLEEKLGPELSKTFIEIYGIREKGNVSRDPFNEFRGLNILHVSKNIEEAALILGKTPTEIQNQIRKSKKILFSSRQQRKRPHLDDKILTGWNGLMIGALSRGSQVLNDPELLKEAIGTATFIKNNLFDPSNNTLKRRYRNGDTAIPGQLEDYAYLVEGLLHLYQATQNPDWLDWAINLTKRQIKIFWNEDGNYFFDSVVDPSVRVRMREAFDGSEPAGNSVAISNLLILSQLHGEPDWYNMAEEIIRSFSDSINESPTDLPLMLTGLSRIQNRKIQVVIAGERGADDTDRLLKIAASRYAPSRILILADGAENQQYLAKRLPFMQSVNRLNNQATAYVCSDFTCKLPVTAPQDFIKQLDEIESH